jgi:hypothetical protein
MLYYHVSNEISKSKICKNSRKLIESINIYRFFPAYMHNISKIRFEMLNSTRNSTFFDKKPPKTVSVFNIAVKILCCFRK